MFRYETEAGEMGYRRIAGVDEAGRGPLAGPVVAAAVILPVQVSLSGLTDSKKLSPSAREKFFPMIRSVALGYGVAVVSEEVIDEINILQASLLAMKLAVEKLREAPDCLLLDGIHSIKLPVYQKTIIEGDSRSLSIAAASVLAKVTRDRLMADYHVAFPQYGFDQHKGYGTQLHRDRIRQFGPCPIHRKTFKGVREFLAV
ncbi:MAG: ribonuclease HII [Nitrospinae bacterium RIFCSPLOWO2_12_FULL_47_7]|nr:MAG: ribonuclease HII [Nitrospinae bacterium RIFCSPLOWO2_12_FULL_47_7]